MCALIDDIYPSAYEFREVSGYIVEDEGNEA
jgi:hypothetical protein